MTEAKLIKLLKIAIGIGLFLLVLGYCLLHVFYLPEKMGVSGMIIGASCIAFGLIFSLPTKMYLTFLLVMREQEKDKDKQDSDRQ
ncbi:hypothetical protein FE810_08655 [Thalassotalea litorea]|uniref:Uncharacterized protein n=1 Tax=Thalassotalea litorea TaxID=2020715 RepID=A0A5R9IQ47_9GAMM|nr:hypothetical protein [Thalassotalea litorea]TLU65346.1 hypothetical protein FE810_08655 [Thalassotalea litorea]